MVNLPRGHGYIAFKKRADAEKALLYMDGHLHEGSQLHHMRNGLQIKGLNHPGVHLTHHLGVVLILHLFVTDQILLLSGVVAHLLARDHYLQLEGTRLNVT
ncbi:hypothetical protein ZEAMMB73_Zm00001d040295 [Zea mays]|uniref:RRM domain-containing protein n=1 Tax=Zea mays TaxID=4577 RepID=A0A1D6MPT7_MAIZE|nr:hypothetical protein ZEAMMB73_Zm00001d040295 [Zea mays]